MFLLVCLFACLFLCLFVCLFVSLFVSIRGKKDGSLFRQNYHEGPAHFRLMAALDIWKFSKQRSGPLTLTRQDVLPASSKKTRAQLHAAPCPSEDILPRSAVRCTWRIRITLRQLKPAVVGPLSSLSSTTISTLAMSLENKKDDGQMDLGQVCPGIFSCPP